ncbi:hypothetical protein IF1G_05308 [Cordyceps javanica]|uniref:Uncharacterized protein n=1 Tax=Cordyceps javanica TaxID=43265 RepID=A0A545V1B4_9HYPO|nr:hypothetical protein IF1G_05308 [Cordyceps javanica]
MNIHYSVLTARAYLACYKVSYLPRYLPFSCIRHPPRSILSAPPLAAETPSSANNWLVGRKAPGHVGQKKNFKKAKNHGSSLYAVPANGSLCSNLLSTRRLVHTSSMHVSPPPEPQSPKAPASPRGGPLRPPIGNSPGNLF